MARTSRSTAAAGAALAAALVLAALASGCGDVKDSEPNLVRGKQLFTTKCGSCHVLDRAGTKGAVGPNLDAAFRQSLSDGLERSTVEGVLHKQILYPDRDGVMPAKLVDGQDAKDVAAYVAYAVDRGGKDTGILANAVAGVQKKTAVASGGKLEIPTDPNGQLAYLVSAATAPAGQLTINSKNASSTPHNIAISGPGANAAGKVIANGATSTVSVTVKPGAYQFFCTVPGHRQAGMQGTITVK